MSPASLNVAIYLYPTADLLDFSGPTEIYSYPSRSGHQMFIPTTFAHSNPVTSSSPALVYVPNETFATLSANLADYDILVIPGAPFEVVEKFNRSREGKEVHELLRTFVGLKPREGSHRFLQSVCSGSIILAAAGILAGRIATTHHMGLDILKKVADTAANGDSKIKVVRERWVDGGVTDAGVRIVNAGGVSSGIDTSLWVIEQVAGKEAEEWAAEVSEFERRDAAWGIKA